jgi:hypothetical protein
MSKQINNGGPAFPQHVAPQFQQRPELWGMTLRDYFAAKAMQGLLVNVDDDTCESLTEEGATREQQDLANEYATFAYRYADAMLAAREAKGGGA